MHAFAGTVGIFYEQKHKTGQTQCHTEVSGNKHVVGVIFTVSHNHLPSAVTQAKAQILMKHQENDQYQFENI